MVWKTSLRPPRFHAIKLIFYESQFFQHNRDLGGYLVTYLVKEEHIMLEQVLE